MSKIRILSALAATVLLTACQPALPDGVHELTYASPYAPGHPFSRADTAWMEFVEQESGGRLQVRAYWSGSLLSSSHSMAEIRHGVADIGLITPIYTRGGAHLVRGQSGYYGGVTSIEDQIAVYKCLEADFPQIRNELRGLKVLAVQGGALPGVLTRDRTVQTLEDLRGLRIRVPAELTGLMRQLGADPVDMPMGEVYSALAKGVIDGVVAPPDTFSSLHFGEIAKNYTSLRVPRGAYPARAMSMQAYNELPADLQAVLNDSQEVWEAALADNIRSATARGIEAGDEAGVVTTPVSDEVQVEFDTLYNEAALQDARALQGVGVDGEPVFRRAQELIANPDRIAGCQ